MPDLSVTEYDQAEESAISVSANIIVQAFQPRYFLQIGYPVLVHQEAELFKCIDVMPPTGFEKQVSEHLGGISEQEFDLVRRLTSLIFEDMRV